MAKSEPKPVDRNAWMATFSDLITLMLTFFVLLLTMSTIDTSRLRSLFQYFPGAGMMMEGGAPSIVDSKRAMIEPFKISSRSGQKRWLDEQDEEPYHALTRWLESRQLDKNVKVIRRGDAYEIHLDNRVVFGAGSVEINPEFVPFLHEVAQTLKEQTGARLRVQVVSSDPNDLAQQSVYKSLWTLATKRSFELSHALISRFKADRRRLSLIGYGEARKIMAEGQSVETFDQRVEFIFVENDDSASAAEPGKRED